MAEATININVKTDNTGVKSLKQELREANLEAQKLSSTPGPEFDAAILKAAELRDRLNDVNEQVGVLTAGSKFEALGNQLGDIGGKILSLDFEGANESAQRLVKLTKSITLGDAVKGVKDLGSTFLNLGKALLTNPLFLIGAAIALAVTAVVKLLDKMGVLKKIGEAIGWIFEKIGEFIEYIADSTAAVVDMVFGTTLVAEKQAQKLAEQQDKLLESVKARSQAVVEGADREIKEQKALGKNTEALEKRKLELIVKTAEVEFRLYQERFKNKTYLAGLDQEEIENQRKLYKESLKGLKDAKSDLKVFNNEQQVEKDNAIKKDAESSKAAAEKARLAAKQYRADRLAAERQFEDLRLANLPEGVEKELAINAEKYKRLIEDAKRNEKLLASEREKIITELSKQQASSEEKINKDNKDKILAKEKEFSDLLKSFAVEETLTKEQEIIKQTENRIAELTKGASIEQQKTQEFIDAKNAIEIDGLKKLSDFKIATEAELAQRERDAALQLASTSLEDKLVILEKERALELQQKDLTESEKLLIDQSYSDKRKELIESERQAKIKAAQDDIALAKQGLDSVQSLTDAVFAAKLAKVEKGSKEEEKLARKQFQVNKAMQLGGAIIDASKAVLSSLAASPIAIGPVPNPAGIASLAFVAASSIANIAKISSAKFGGTGGGAPPSSTPPSTSTSSSSPAAQPQFNLFGQANQGNNVGPNGIEPSTSAININSTVSVSEINAVQNKVAVQEERSTL